MNFISTIDKKLSENKITGFFLNRQIFSLLYICVCILWFFPLLGAYVDIISKLCFCWGAVLIAYDLVTRRQAFNSYASWFLVFFMASYVITILLNRQDMLYMGIKHIVYNGIFLLILYSADLKKSREKYITYLKIINNIIISTALVSAFISFILYLFSVSFIVKTGEVSIRQGFLENRLFGIYTSPNTGALMAIISLVLIIMNYFLYNKNVGKWKIVYIINIVMQVIYYSLTLSKGGFLTFSVFAVLAVSLFLFPKLLKKHNIAISTFYCAITSVVLVALIIAVPTLLRSALSYTPALVQRATWSMGIVAKPQGEDELTEKIEFVRIESGDDASNGRLDIWMSGFTAWKHAPVFGLADINIVNADKSISSKVDKNSFSEQNIKDLIKANGDMHNSYVQIIVCSGAIGFLLFIAFAVFVVKKYLFALIKMDSDSFDYKIIASITCLVGLLAANGLVENHLLFNRQDPYGAIFWFYLGVGIAFIRFYFKDNMEKQGRFAFICDTPIQVLNALNFVSNDIEGCKGKSDIYIYHQFSKSHDISEKLKKKDYFENVYDVQILKNGKGIISPLFTLFRLVFPDIIIKKNVAKWNEKNEFYYKKLIICAYAPFQILLRKKYRDAELIALEEGLASYFGNNMQDGNSKLMNLTDKFLFDGELQARAKSLYVNNLTLCSSTISEKIFELPKISDEKFLTDCKFIFDYKDNDLYNGKKMILLSQPYCEILDNAEAFDKNLRELIVNSNINNNCIVRKHPRQKENLYYDIPLDNYCNSWELESIVQLNDENVLLSIFSTSEVIPYILANKHPYLVFAYKIALKGYDESKIALMDNFVSNLKEKYGEASKIFVPKTFDELSDVLKSLNK